MFNKSIVILKSQIYLETLTIWYFNDLSGKAAPSDIVFRINSFLFLQRIDICSARAHISSVLKNEDIFTYEIISYAKRASVALLDAR